MVQIGASNWYLFAGLGLLAGIASGALGVGSGIIVIPALVFWLEQRKKRRKEQRLPLCSRWQ